MAQFDQLPPEAVTFGPQIRGRLRKKDRPSSERRCHQLLLTRLIYLEHEANLLRQIINPLEKPLLGQRPEALIEFPHPAGDGVEFEEIEIRQPRENF